MTQSPVPKKFLYALLAIALAWSLVEAVSFGLLRYRGWPLLAQEQRPSENKGATELAGFKKTRALNEASPFFGYVYHRGNGVNNLGFASLKPYPYAKQPNDFVIGVLGASVAHYLYTYLDDENFKNELKRRIPALSGRDVVVLNLAISGYKQPQQFIVFSYFVENLDMILQIDGWNEASQQPQEYYPENFPAFSDVLYSDDSFLKEKVKVLTGIRELTDHAKEYVSRNSALSYSAFLSLVIEASEKALENIAVDMTTRISHPPFSSGSDPEANRKRAENWSKYVELEDLIARQRNIRDFFFIQPSQYVKDSKAFTENEKKVAFADYYAEAAPAFERLRSEGAALRAKGAPVFDLNNVFKNEARDVYIDNCCHLNETGYRLVAESILDAVVSNWPRQVHK